MRAIPWKLWLLAVLSAALQMLPFPIAGPVPLWRRAFCWVCLTPLLWIVLYGKTSREARSSQCRQHGWAMPAVSPGTWVTVIGFTRRCICMAACLSLPRWEYCSYFSMYFSACINALFAGLLGWLRRVYSPVDCFVCRAIFVGCGGAGTGTNYRASMGLTGIYAGRFLFTDEPGSMDRSYGTFSPCGRSKCVRRIYFHFLETSFAWWSAVAGLLFFLLWAYRSGPRLSTGFLSGAGDGRAVLTLQENLSVGAEGKDA